MNIGHILLILAFFSSIYSAFLFFIGSNKRNVQLLKKAEKYSKYTIYLINLSSLLLLYYFLTDNFLIRYVASYSSRNLDLFYKISAFWAGSDGSLLLWAWILSLYILAILRIEKKDVLTAFSLSISLSVLSFFLFLLSTISNPFSELRSMPTDGIGLNPLLQTPEMAVHPPTLFTGYAGAVIVFSFAFAGVYFANDKWVFRARKWIVFTWFWLTQGIFWGAIWAYKVLGWGGFWAWDPVENASLLPWLTISALMHSIMIQEARRGMKLWNILLAFTTFEFVLLGTYITRSGVISSVHAFGQSKLTLPFSLFMLIWLLITLYVIVKRKSFIRSENVVESVLSKEATFLFNNLILVVMALTIFWGTIFPLISEGLAGYKVTIGPPFYNQVITPLSIALLILLGICVAIPWRTANLKDLKRFLTPLIAAIIVAVMSIILSQSLILSSSLSLFTFAFISHLYQYIKDLKSFSEDERNYIKVIIRKRRRYGGYTAHLGILLLLIGITGWAFDEKYELSLELDKPVTIEDYTLIYKGLESRDSPLKTSWYAVIEVWKGKKLIEVAKPSIDRYNSGEEIRRPSIISEALNDVYITYNGGYNVAFVDVKINPFVNFIYLSFIIISIGGILALIPRSFALKIISEVSV